MSIVTINSNTRYFFQPPLAPGRFRLRIAHLFGGIFGLVRSMNAWEKPTGKTSFLFRSDVFLIGKTKTSVILEDVSEIIKSAVNLDIGFRSYLLTERVYKCWPLAKNSHKDVIETS